MQYATEIWAIVWAFTLEIYRSPANYAILVVAWFAVEATGSLFSLLISLPKLRKPTRLRLYGLVQRGKFYGSALWCAILVWIPYAQPDLCGADRAEGCQTIMGRLAVAVVLGLGLSVGHKLVAPRLRRILGRAKTRRVVCSSCRKSVKIGSFEDPCPECGEVPHEVTAVR
ncbi:hypothetical protein LCGC14_2721050 [marine sediment metagenome]|uniref:Uncharacterized protein n=2 Tax=root TaxID=1 RepID=A0A9C9NIX0_9HYPH|nr:hypothetical protein [Aurantimonas coralicida]